MFNFLFRPYVPGFRVGTDGVPGFNIDDGLLQRTSASSDGRLPESAAQRYPDAAPAQSPPSISFHLPGAEGWVLSAPPIGSPGFRVSPQDNVPGFNVGPQDDALGFSPDENGVQQPETTWPDGVEDPAPPVPPELPEWFYKLGTMLPPWLSTAFDPRTEQPTSINSLPGLGSAAARGADLWPPPNAPSPQPAAQQAMRTAWRQPLKGGWPYAQGDGALPPISSVQPPADSSSSPASTDDAAEQQAQQQMQRTMPSAPLGTGPAMVHMPQQPGLKMTELERGAEQEFSQLIEAYRRLKDAEGRRPISDQRSLQPPLNENGASSYATGNEAPSLGQRLVQSSVETLVPGAHYQELARQQLGAGNCVGAGVYQAAALLDAALGVATLGLGTRLAAAGRTATAEGAALFRRAFDSRDQLLRYLGRAPAGMQWHHIVEQSQAAQFGQRRIQSVENIVAIPIEAHHRLNAFYSSKQPISYPNTIREWLRGQPFEKQYQYGMERLKQVLWY
jgi:hypothetical protein